LKYVPGAIPGKPLNQKMFQLGKEKENMRSIVLKENLTVTVKPKDPGKNLTTKKNSMTCAICIEHYDTDAYVYQNLKKPE